MNTRKEMNKSDCKLLRGVMMAKRNGVILPTGMSPGVHSARRMVMQLRKPLKHRQKKREGAAPVQSGMAERDVSGIGRVS